MVSRASGAQMRVLSAYVDLPPLTGPEAAPPVASFAQSPLSREGPGEVILSANADFREAGDARAVPSLPGWRTPGDRPGEDRGEAETPHLDIALQHLEADGDSAEAGSASGDPSLHRAVVGALAITWLARSGRTVSAGGFARELQASKPASPPMGQPGSAPILPLPPRSAMPPARPDPYDAMSRGAEPQGPSGHAVKPPSVQPTVPPGGREVGPGVPSATTPPPAITFETAPVSASPLRRPAWSPFEPVADLGPREPRPLLARVGWETRPVSEPNPFSEEEMVLRRLALASIAMLWLVRTGRVPVGRAAPSGGALPVVAPLSPPRGVRSLPGMTTASPVAPESMDGAPPSGTEPVWLGPWARLPPPTGIGSRSPDATAVPTASPAVASPAADRADTRTVLGLLARDWLMRSSVTTLSGGSKLLPQPVPPAPVQALAESDSSLPEGDDRGPVSGISSLLLEIPDWPGPRQERAVPSAGPAPLPRFATTPARRPVVPGPRKGRPMRSRCHQAETLGIQ